jgi:hypothetical protein
MTLAATDELKLPANYHKLSDTADNLDFDCIDGAVDVLDGTVRALAAQARSNSERAATTAS